MQFLFSERAANKPFQKVHELGVELIPVRRVVGAHTVNQSARHTVAKITSSSSSISVSIVSPFLRIRGKCSECLAAARKRRFRHMPRKSALAGFLGRKRTELKAGAICAVNVGCNATEHEAEKERDKRAP